MRMSDDDVSFIDKTIVRRVKDAVGPVLDPFAITEHSIQISLMPLASQAPWGTVEPGHEAPGHVVVNRAAHATTQSTWAW